MKKLNKKIDYKVMESKFNEGEQDIYNNKNLMESLKSLADK